MLRLKILYEDETLVAIDKPAGFFTHPPEDKNVRMAPRWNALGILEAQLGRKLFPAHRLDRATSGVLVYAKDAGTAASLQRQFRTQGAKKTYACFVRGRTPNAFECNTPLSGKDGVSYPSLTHFTAIHTVALPWPSSPSGMREFSLLLANPVTGRFHQIRRHLASLSFPIVGDKRHGDKKVNRAFLAVQPREQLYLRALSLEITALDMPIEIRARWPGGWHALFDAIGFCPLTSSQASLEKP